MQEKIKNKGCTYTSEPSAVCPVETSAAAKRTRRVHTTRAKAVPGQHPPARRMHTPRSLPGPAFAKTRGRKPFTGKGSAPTPIPENVFDRAFNRFVSKLVMRFFSNNQPSNCFSVLYPKLFRKKLSRTSADRICNLTQADPRDLSAEEVPEAFDTLVSELVKGASSELSKAEAMELFDRFIEEICRHAPTGISSEQFDRLLMGLFANLLGDI
ncbi:uncharacterized protein NEMAJ01_1190 [Nematocida major]|uniref:uncharacterized protein n=1 Tax=Nematocida major TaxID=1912982 RepID=UPI002008B9D1|nr:uncharacterized protein NEMAJ01_1190 [Nematocida major]KAH9386294.1 hypothetical protein NEMAJ01_1190 [Nematocida major]